MRIQFRPLLQPTLWFIFLFAVLIGLGVWQVERLHWKEGLIREIQTRMAAAPASLAQVYGAGQEQTPYQRAEDADYRRVFVKGSFENNKEIYFFGTGPGGIPVYHVLTPFETARGLLLVDRGYVPVGLRDPATRKAGALGGVRTVVGVLHQPDAANLFTPPPDMDLRVVHTRDPAVLSQVFRTRFFPMILEADATPNPGGWPKGGQTVVDLPNNHLQYAITWFALALGLLIVYLAYHREQGRLKFEA